MTTFLLLALRILALRAVVSLVAATAAWATSWSWRLAMIFGVVVLAVWQPPNGWVRAQRERITNRTTTATEQETRP